MGMREILVLDTTGHTKTTWDSEKEDEVKAARRTYDDLTKKGYTAFLVKKDGTEGKQMKEFEESAEAMIMVPRIAAG